jgi:hypothetical protein
MYDLITSALLFVILTPGVVLTLPPGASVITAAIVHAIVFYVVQAFVSRYVPWWGIWIIAVVVIAARMYTPSAPTY